jgi:hypothetical protein
VGHHFLPVPHHLNSAHGDTSEKGRVLRGTKGKSLYQPGSSPKKNEIYINRRVCYRKQVTEVVEEEKGQKGKMRQP